VNIVFGLILTLSVVLLDQGTKYSAFLSGGIISQNQGLFFGLVTIAPWFHALISITFLVGAILCTWYYKLYQNTMYFIGLSLMVGGILSNGIDRLFLGAIRDIFMVFTITRLNLADILLTIGGILISIAVLKQTEVFNYHGKQTTRR